MRKTKKKVTKVVIPEWDFPMSDVRKELDKIRKRLERIEKRLESLLVKAKDWAKQVYPKDSKCPVCHGGGCPECFVQEDT